MIRVIPFPLRTVAHVDREVTVEVEGPGYFGRPKNKTWPSGSQISKPRRPSCVSVSGALNAAP